MRRQPHGVLALCTLLLCSVGSAAYITDRLAVGLYPQQDLSGEPLALVESGTALDVRERHQQSLRVRLGDGREGWIDPAYVSDAKPAATRLLEMQVELTRLRAAGEDVAREIPPPAPPEPATVGSWRLWAATAGGAVLGLALGVGLVEYRLRRIYPDAGH
jgi:hypothetical protein